MCSSDLKVINRALEGIPGPTVVHLCFGYAYVVFNKPAGYTFLAQLADCVVEQISIEAAQPKVDFGVLKELSSKKMILGMISLENERVESPEEVAARARRALEHLPAERLILALDRLTAPLDKAALAKLEPDLKELFALAQSIPDFAPEKFAKTLESFAKKL
mgnify:CR=1 FL=1